MKDQVVRRQTQSQFEEAPLYIRWNAESSPYAIEMRLDVVAHISQEMREAEKQGVEIGGILIGTHPDELSPTLRIDDFQLVRRRAEDGPIFMLDPKERDRFLTSRWDATIKGRSGVGFFRTHLRPGPMRPSLADRTFLTPDLKDQTHAILLISGTEPYMAAVFVGAQAELLDTPSIPEFRFDDQEFRSLPEVSNRSGRGARSQMGWQVWAAVIFAILLAVAGEIYHLKTGVPGDPNSIELAVTGNQILDITWNRSSSDLTRATSAKLIILDGQIQREISIGQDELRLGRVRYQRTNPEVKVTLQLQMPDATSLTQSTTWSPAG